MSHVIIDDQDLSRVKYNGTWIRGGGANEHEGTVASSTVVGDSFTVNFTGTSIVVYGTIDVTSEGVVSSYAVDSAPPAQITSQGGSGDTFNQQFWKSPILPVGEHTLQVQMLKVNSDPTPGEGTIWFDYFLATDPTIRPSTSPSKKNVGAMAGGIVGGLVVLALGIFFFLFVRRRKVQRISVNSNPDPIHWPKQDFGGTVTRSGFNAQFISLGHPTVEPFIIGPTEEGSEARTPSSWTPHPQSELVSPTRSKTLNEQRDVQSSVAASSSTMSNFTEAANPTVIARKHRQATAASRIQPSADQAHAAVVPENPEPVQHVDSGERVIDPQVIDIPARPVELPPVYSPV